MYIYFILEYDVIIYKLSCRRLCFYEKSIYVITRISCKEIVRPC